MSGKFCSFALYKRVKEILLLIIVALFLSVVVCSCKEEPTDGPCFMPSWYITVISGDDFSVVNHLSFYENPPRIQCDVGDGGGIAVIQRFCAKNEVINGLELIDYALDIEGDVTERIEYGRCTIHLLFPNIIHLSFKPRAEGENKNFKVYVWESEKARGCPIYINYR